MTKASPDSQPPDRMRLDKWLWAARFYKTRTLASHEVRRGRMRLNGVHVKKAAALVAPDDVLTFPKAQRIFVIRIKGLADRRGPAEMARLLYEDLSPPVISEKDKVQAEQAVRAPGSGRPTKAERRALDRLRGEDWENSLKGRV